MGNMRRWGCCEQGTGAAGMGVLSRLNVRTLGSGGMWRYAVLGHDL